VVGNIIFKRRFRATHQSLRENNGGRFLLRGVDRYYCILEKRLTMNYYVPIQHKAPSYKEQRDE